METNNEIKAYQRRYPWLSIIVGIIFVAVGIWCIFTPISTDIALTILFIAGFFAAGFFEIVSAFYNTQSHNWGWRLATGIIDLLLAIWLCAIPMAEAAQVLIYVVGFYICFYSAMGIGESCQLKKTGYKAWGWMLALCIVGLICSFLFIFSPMFGAVYLSWLCGLSFISYGLFRCMA